MRCPECGKFAKYGEPAVEVVDFGATDETLEAEVRVGLVCAEDETELKELIFNLTSEVDHTCDLERVVAHQLKETEPDKLGTDDVDKAVADREFEVSDCTAEPLEGAKGKKSTYGATVVWTATCSACGDQIEAMTEQEEEASEFEEVA